MKDNNKTKPQLLEELQTLRRSASVEKCLDRVRQVVAAMKESTDLFAVGDEIQTQLAELEVTNGDVGINIVDRSTRTMRNFEPGGSMEPVPLVQGHELYDGFWDHWSRGEIWCRFHSATQVEGFVMQDVALGVSSEQQARRDWKSFVRDCWRVDVPFEHGTLAIRSAGDSAFSDDDLTCLGRFTAVFAFGYQRFLDFQRLEEQAERMQRERAVERVRAEAMSMRSTDDMEKVVSAMFEEIELGRAGSHDLCAIELLENGLMTRFVAYKSLDDDGRPCDHGSGFVKVEKTIGLKVDGLNRDMLKQKKPWSFSSTGSMDRVRPWLHDQGITEPISWKPFIGDWSHFCVPFEFGQVSIRERKFSQEHMDLVEMLTESLSIGYLRYLDFQRAEDELHKARTLQMGLMPKTPPELPNFQIASHCEPATQVGGDYFQYFHHGDVLSVSAADVTGHAMEAAIPVVMFDGILATFMNFGTDLEELFAGLNDIVVKRLTDRTHVCFSMIQIDIVTRAVRFANAGYPYPYHYRAASGDIAELEVNAYPLGARAGTTYAAIETQLEPGDRLVLCSDGIMEALNTDDEVFGFERTEATILTGCKEGLSADALLNKLLRAARNFSGEREQEDDQTIIVVAVED